MQGLPRRLGIHHPRHDFGDYPEIRQGKETVDILDLVIRQFWGISGRQSSEAE